RDVDHSKSAPKLDSWHGRILASAALPVSETRAHFLTVADFPLVTGYDLFFPGQRLADVFIAHLDHHGDQGELAVVRRHIHRHAIGDAVLDDKEIRLSPLAHDDVAGNQVGVLEFLQQKPHGAEHSDRKSVV